MKNLFGKFLCILIVVAMLTSILPVVSMASDGLTTGGKIITLDYSTYRSDDGLSEYDITGATEASFSIVPDTVGSSTKNVLKYTISTVAHGNYTVGMIPLGETISTTNGKEFTIKVKAKLSGSSNRMLRGFPSLSDGTTDNIFGLSWMRNDTSVMINANGFNEGIWLFKGTNSSGQTVDTGGSVKNNIDMPSKRFFLDHETARTQYITYKWVVDPVSRTFKFYYSTDDGVSWTEPYSERTMLNTNTTDVADDRLPAGVFPTGTLPDTISCLKIRELNQAGAVNQTDNSTYIAAIEVEQGVQRPKVISTSIADGAENVSKNTQIDVNFDMEILPSSITKENFELSKVGEGIVSQDMYSVVQSNDKKTVMVVLNEGYAYDYDSTYNLTVKDVKANTQLAASMEGTKEISFVIETQPEVQRPKVISTSIADGTENVSKNTQIDVNFDMEILPSSITKENFELSKVGEGVISHDMYSVVQSDDKKTITIVLNEGYTYEYDNTYKLTVKNVKANTQLAPSMAGTKEISFKIELDPEAPGGTGGFEGMIDYSNFSDEDVREYNSDKSVYSIKDGALEIKTTTGTSYPEIPLGDLAFKTTEGAFSVQIRAKLPETLASHIRQFPSFSDGSITYANGLGYYTNEQGLYLNAANRSDAMWTRKRHNGSDASVGALDNNVDLKQLSQRFFANLTSVSSEFYDFRYDVTPTLGIFRFYYKKASDEEWIEPWGENYMINPATGDRYTTAGVFPIGDGLPENITHLTYRVVANSGADIVLLVKSIKVEQMDIPSISSIKIDENSVADGVSEVEPDAQFDILLSTMVRPETVTKDNIYIVDLASGERISKENYNLVQAPDRKTIKLMFNHGFKLDYSKNYALIVEKLKAFTQKQGEMKETESFNFTTLSSYAVERVEIIENTSDINVSFDFNDYVKENNGKKHAIIATLVDKTTNTTHSIKAFSAISENSGNAIVVTPYNFNLSKPEDFDITKFEVRIYLWDDFINSKGILRINKDILTVAQ